MLYTRYCVRQKKTPATATSQFRSLHNNVYIKYVHNRQIFEKSQNSIEICGILEYSIKHREIKVGRNNIFGINCDCVPFLPQDIAPIGRQAF